LLVRFFCLAKESQKQQDMLASASGCFLAACIAGGLLTSRCSQSNKAKEMFQN